MDLTTNLTTRKIPRACIGWVYSIICVDVDIGIAGLHLFYQVAKWVAGQIVN